MKTWKALATVAALLAVWTGVSLTQQTAPPQDKTSGKPAKTDAEKPAKTEAKKPATHKVEKKLFRIELSVKGMLEPREVVEIVYRPQPAPGGPAPGGPLTVDTVVEHGTSVKKGAVLVAFQPQRLDHVIRDLESDKKVFDSNIVLAEEELPLLKKAVPMDMAAATRAKKESEEDLDYFLKIGRPESEKQVDFMVRGAQFYVEYAKEELRQLEKMYKANDLTEETEQIILKRQRHGLERAEFWFKQAVIERDLILKVELPRREKSLKDNVIKQALTYEKAKSTLTPLVNQRQQSLAKLGHERDKIADRLDKARKDRAGLTIKAPADGIVYYGKFSKGEWSSATAMASRLVPNGTVMPDEVFMTIVQPRPVVVRLLAEEKDVHFLKSGLAGKAQMVANPEQKLAARVTKVASVPAAPGKFEVLVELDMGGADNLMPGMACSVKFVPYAKKDTVAVPSTAVFEEDDEHFVYVVDSTGKSTKRAVTPGHTSQGQTEIRQGLRQGEEMLLERPKSEKSTTPKGGAG